MIGENGEGRVPDFIFSKDVSGLTGRWASNVVLCIKELYHDEGCLFKRYVLQE